MGNKKYPWPPNRKMKNDKEKTHILVVNTISVKKRDGRPMNGTIRWT